MLDFFFVLQYTYHFSAYSLMGASLATVSFCSGNPELEASLTCEEFVFFMDCSASPGYLLSYQDRA
jgi:hypothetical protein